MDEDKTAVIDSGEAETPEVESPTTEEKTASEEVETAEKPEETPTTEDETVEESVDQSRQGKAFAEMRNEIKRLKEEVAEKKTRQSLFDQGQQLFSQPQYQSVDPNRFYDANGQFNRYAYDQAVAQATANNQEVSRQAAAQTVDFKLDEWKARVKHPELNTNKKFERAVANEYQAQLIESAYDPSKRAKSIEEIADEYAPYYKGQQKTVKQVTEQVRKQLTEKEQAALSSSGRSQPGISTQGELDELRVRSRQGDKTAIAERLRRLRKA